MAKAFLQHLNHAFGGRPQFFYKTSLIRHNTICCVQDVRKTKYTLFQHSSITIILYQVSYSTYCSEVGRTTVLQWTLADSLNRKIQRLESRFANTSSKAPVTSAWRTSFITFLGLPSTSLRMIDQASSSSGHLDIWTCFRRIYR